MKKERWEAVLLFDSSRKEYSANQYWTWGKTKEEWEKRVLTFFFSSKRNWLSYPKLMKSRVGGSDFHKHSSSKDRD